MAGIFGDLDEASGVLRNAPLTEGRAGTQMIQIGDEGWRDTNNDSIIQTATPTTTPPVKVTAQKVRNDTARPPPVKKTTTKTPAISQYKTYYYSGGQAQVYMEDIFLDEVNNLQFSTVTNKSPIYGYSSMLFDTVATGNLLVQGSFTINFVNSNYLNILAQFLKDGSQGTAAETKGVKLRPEYLQDILQWKSLETLSEFEIRQILNHIRGLGNKEFLNMATNIAFRESEIPVKKFYEIPPFDIFAVFGDEKDVFANHTVRKIKNVYLTAQGQVIQSSGDVIQEQYSFIARDIE